MNDLRDNLANFDDSSGRCATTSTGNRTVSTSPSCAALRSVFDSLDGISKLSDQFGKITASLDKLNALQPQLLALLPPQIAIQESQPRPDPVQLRHHRRHQPQSEEALRERDRDGTGVRRRQERRLVLPAARSVRQRRLQARPQTVPLARRQGRPHDHHA